MAFVGFEESKGVRQLAESIIDEHHPHLKDAKQQIGFYLREVTASGQERRRNAQRSNVI
ncbi:hypothetical protein BACVE_003040 [Bacillus velezensis]|uniref:Uncharacterized protein n=1 Tax=Bacillus velezensis TaxID=492670 RepID=A0A7S7KSH9_BACVE|nr:hypothetical protein [Bacillus velezensis]QOY28000.1 hypothetical protein BACVE_003040 [Bacillus velezensis]